MHFWKIETERTENENTKEKNTTASPGDTYSD